MPAPEQLPFRQGLVAHFHWQLSDHLAWFPPTASYGLLMALAHSLAWALSVPQCILWLRAVLRQWSHWFLIHSTICRHCLKMTGSTSCTAEWYFHSISRL